MGKGRPVDALILTAEERSYLERQVRRHRVTRSLSERCRIVLRCADDTQSKQVAAELGVSEHMVGKWRRRFLRDRIEGLLDEPRSGRPRSIDDDAVAAVIERTLQTLPTDATHWSIRSMAAATGHSHTTIRRMWSAFGLQPHRAETFKLSSGPLFVDKVRGYRRPLPFAADPCPAAAARKPTAPRSSRTIPTAMIASRHVTGATNHNPARLEIPTRVRASDDWYKPEFGAVPIQSRR